MSEPAAPNAARRAPRPPINNHGGKMTIVTMSRQISGTRNGVAWPAPGNTIELPENEAEGLVNLGMATTSNEPAVERAATRTAEPTRRADKPPAKKTAAKK